MKKWIGRLVYVLNWPYIKFVLKSERAYVLLVDKRLAEVFLVKNLVRWHDTWWLPGGGLNRGENLIQAVCREAREEIGLRLDPAGLEEFLTLPGGNRRRAGKRTVFAYAFEKRALSYNRAEIAEAAWHSLAGEIAISDSFRPVIAKARRLYG